LQSHKHALKHTKAICPDEQGREEVQWEMTVTASDTVGDLGIRKEWYNKWKCCHMSNDEHDGKAQAGKGKHR